MSARTRALVLGALAAAFLARVAGQGIVAVAPIPCLPPMASWYSGLVPYSVLLPVQVAILLAQASISRDLWRGRGRYARVHPTAGPALRRIAYVYAAVMMARWALTSGHRIPIVFHFVLATYLRILAGHHQRRVLFAGDGHIETWHVA
jgi:hypothetical protein